MGEKDKESAKDDNPDSVERKRKPQNFQFGSPSGVRMVEGPDGNVRFFSNDGREISSEEHRRSAEYFRARRDFLRQRETKQKPKSPMETAFFISKALFSLVIILGIIRFGFVFFDDHGVDKVEIQKAIRTIVSNGGELGTIKHVYENRERYTATLPDFYQKLPSTYEYDTPLSIILNDIKADFYLQEKVSDTESILTPLNKIISDHDTSNPFDKLEIAQKDLFLNIQLKLPNEYSLIENDTNKIADELHNKNLLVQEYLANSETSLRVSWGALFIALLIGVTQIYLSFKRQRETIKHLTETNRFEPNNDNTGENAPTASDVEEMPETDGTTEPEKAG